MGKRKRWNKVSAEYLLKLDPFYNRKINDCEEFVPSERIFFKKIYVEPSRNNGSWITHEKIYDKISERTKNLILCIKGYAGCGKSVYIQKIMYDLYPKNDNFGTNTYNLKPSGSIHRLEIGAGTSLNDIESRYVDDLSKSMADTIINDKDIFTTFCSIIGDNDDAIKYIDNGHELHDKFIFSNSIKNCLQKSSQELREAIRAELKHFKAPLLFAIDCLWRIALHAVLKQKSEKDASDSMFFICFDNLDAINDIDMCQDFIKDLCEFKLNFDECLYILNNHHKEYYVETFTFIISCRNVTWGRLHLSEYAEDDDATDNSSHLLDFDISRFFEYVNIVSERIKYYTALGKNTVKATKILAEMDTIRRLNNMRYIKERFKPLFNYNYRKCIEVIGSILRDSPDNLSQAIDLAGHDTFIEDDGVFSGSSSIFFRLVFDYFKSKELFNDRALDLINLDAVLDTDISNSTLTSIARILLLYLYNETKKGTLGRTRLDQMFEYFNNIYSHDEICDTLYKLFVRNPAWRRPISFSKRPLKEHEEKEDLEKQMQEFEAHHIQDPDIFTQFEICRAGEEYIEFVVAHFEFFSCRVSRVDMYFPPLYTKKSFEYLEDIDKYWFELTSEAVLQAVEACCNRLGKFNNVIMSCKHLGLEDYLKEPVIKTTNRKKNPQLHEERIIFCHIFHLESYRNYIINSHMQKSSEDDRADVNRRFVGIISRYISLYDTYIISKQRDSIASTLAAKIKIIEKSNYFDFETKITAN